MHDFLLPFAVVYEPEGPGLMSDHSYIGFPMAQACIAGILDFSGIFVNIAETNQMIGWRLR
jgi:hypothetical protein